MADRDASSSSPSNAKYEFTEDWFSGYIPIWNEIVAQIKPSRILEIGSFEGRSTCYLIETSGASRDLEIHCVDTWEGGAEHREIDMSGAEQRFRKNTSLAVASVKHKVELIIHKKPSFLALAELVAAGRVSSFDMIYVDGSHQAPDVLSDAVLSFHLLRTGGLLVFDDYLWSMEGPGKQDPFNMPKPAIDSFVNIYQRKLNILSAQLYQIYAQKTAV